LSALYESAKGGDLQFNHHSYWFENLKDVRISFFDDDLPSTVKIDHGFGFVLGMGADRADGGDVVGGSFVIEKWNFVGHCLSSARSLRYSTLRFHP
jgi:hypothetical protein